MTLLVPALAVPDVFRNLLAGLVMIGVLVVIHELGHFLFAKLFGIGVPVFSVGMGPRLFGFRWRGTDYRVSALPIGGYVQMAGADPFGEQDASSRVDPDEDFMRKPVWQRLVVMLAGPAFNLVLPFMVFTAVLMAGEPQSAPWIGVVLDGTPAERAGIREGDWITAINGEPVEVFGDVIDAFDAEPDRAHTLTVATAEDAASARAAPSRQVVLPAGTIQHSFDGYVDLDAVGMMGASLSSRVGVDDPNSPAARAGLRTGDMITHVDGVELDTWNELAAALTPEGPHALKVTRATEEDGQSEHTVQLAPGAGYTPRPDDAWANPWGLAPVMLYVGKITPASAAEEAGIRAMDRLWSIDGELVTSWTSVVHLVGASVEGRTEQEGPRPLAVEVLRGGAIVPLTLTPRVTRQVVRGDVRYRPLMGIERFPTAYVNGPIVQKYYGFLEAVPRSVEQGIDVLTSTFAVLGRLITWDLKPSEALGGPVEIFRAAGAGAEAGLHTFARLLGTISFSLGIVNLLPVPALDGGQIVFYSIEGIRGRPLSLALRERVQMIGVLALAALMLMVTVMDVNRWLSG